MINTKGMPKTLALAVAKYEKRYPGRIEDFSDETGYQYNDGYWIYLSKGWCSDPALHCIHEWTVRDMIQQFSRIEACDCDECVS